MKVGVEWNAEIERGIKILRFLIKICNKKMLIYIYYI